MVLTGPGADEVQGPLAAGRVEGAAQGLAVDGNQAAIGRLDEGADPVEEALAEGGGVQAGEDPAEGVVGGDAVGQFQESLEPGELVVAVLLDIDPGVGAGDDGTDGEGDDIP